MSATSRAADLSTLFHSTSDLVHRTAWRITGRSEDAEDVLQTVFLHLLREPPSPWPDNPPAYLHRAAVNASLDLLRRRRRRPESPVDDEIASGGANSSAGSEEADALSRLAGQQLAERLREALPLLSPLEAEVFSLRCFEERSNAEIAELLGKTANHVGVTLHAARQKLKEALASAESPAPSETASRGTAS